MNDIVNELKEKNCENTISKRKWTKTNERKWTKKCPNCSKELMYCNHRVLVRSINENWLCKVCSITGENNPSFGLRGKLSKKWKGCGDLTGRYWSVVLRGAKKRNIPIKITINDAWSQFLKQNGKCALSGVDIKLEILRWDGNASLDRIDSTKGYEIGNIQWVDKKINSMKSNMGEKDFIEWCKKVASYRA